MRRSLAIIVLGSIFVSTAAAATIRGTKHADLLQAAFDGTTAVSCGAARDVVSADLADTVSSDCEVVSRRLSVDPYANRDSQHETAVEPDDFAYGDTVVAAFQLGRRGEGAAANIGTAVSNDDGRTWQRAVLTGVTVNAGGAETAASDPTVAYDAVHKVWLVGTLTIHPNGSRVLVARSGDGLHWSAPVDAADGPILDKDWLACDNNTASPFRGRCYLEYTDDEKDVTVSQSSDDGGQTWSQPVRAGSVLVGTQPVIQPSGALTVVAGDFEGEDALTGSMVALHSTDGGATWQTFTVTSFRSADNAPMRAIALPSLDVDSNGTIYAAWHDCRFRPSCTANDVVVSTSADGMRWATPIRATTGPSSFITGIAADPALPGHLALVYAYFHPGKEKALGIALRQSGDGGHTWTAPQRLDTVPMQMSWLPRSEGGRMVGDYFSVAYAGGRVVPVFALAIAPTKTRLHEAIFATSLQALGERR
ncbi:MAG: sialidase family protein [Actinomycetota bacterium]